MHLKGPNMSKRITRLTIIQKLILISTDSNKWLTFVPGNLPYYLYQADVIKSLLLL